MVQAASFGDAVTALRRGQAAIFPTDTVYGVGVAVEYAQSPRILFELKRRDSGKPVAWLVGGADDLNRYGANVPEYAHALARAFWPGPLTMVVQAADAVPQGFRSNTGTVGLRMPQSTTALRLIEEIGSPLAASSANFAGEMSPGSFDEVDPAFAKAVGCVLADAEEKSGVASTVLDCTGRCPKMLREGAISMTEVSALCQAFL